MAYVGTELEFIVFDDTYREAWAKGYRGLTPATDYNIDYAMLASTRMEPLLRDIRLGMDGAGMYCEGVKGECNLGQQEIAFRYDDALVDLRQPHHLQERRQGDRRPARQGLTFMAKFNEREGNSCHIHLSFRGRDGAAVFADATATHGMSKPCSRSFIAGQLATLRELTLFYAPNINSYKRFVEGSFAPDRDRVGHGQPHLRAAGGRPRPRHAGRVPRARRRRQPVPGRRGAHRGRPARHRERARARPDACAGNAYTRWRAAAADHAAPRPRELFEESAVARAAFGDEVVEHYLNNARVELEAFNAAVTDWERVRGFERL